jgi:alpha-L-rhamnosidase
MKLTANGKSGSEIVVKYAETMQDGDIFTLNLRSAEATDRFILSGKGEEEFLPEFTYHGYRYVKIIKPADVKIIDAVTYPVYNDVKETGEFSCSNELINKIYDATVRTIKSNTVSIPTDCPQRNERMGWTGDSQAFCDTAMFLLDYEEFYKKHVLDMVDSTKGRADGLVGAFVPYGFQYALLDNIVRAGFAAWSDAIVIVPYNHYLYYGDKSILTENISTMKSHVDKCYGVSEDGIARVGTYGEHVSAYEQADRTAFSTLYGAYTSLLLSKVCNIIGDSDAKKYSELYEKMKAAFNKEFVDEEGKIKSDTMSLYAEAYEFGIIDDELAKKNLIRKLDQFDNHCVCGMFGTRIILPVLSKLGMADRAFDMITKTTYPSWGYMLENGATSLWELWDSIIDGKMNLERINMNSLNHYMLGGCVRWFYTHLLGINPTEEGAGFKKVIFAPLFAGDLKWAKGKFKSANGDVAVEWKNDGSIVKYQVTVSQKTQVEFKFDQEIVAREEIEKDGSIIYVFKLAV